MKRTPDFEQFLKVLRRKGRPKHLPFYEHLASSGFISRATGTCFDQMKMDEDGYWRIYVNFWLDMGFDCVPMEIGLNCPLPEGHAGLSENSEARVVIRTIRDFENYPWPAEEMPIDFKHFKTVSDLLPDGAKIVGGVAAGPYEWVSTMMGTVGLSYALADNPELVALVFQKMAGLYSSAARQIAAMDGIGALRQGDDLGFKTSTFLRPGLLREYVFPIYKKITEEAHKHDKPFILHSCGNLKDIYEDLINYCKIDAKHSFEDTILPAGEFKKLFGRRVTPLGGLDVDFICRNNEDEIRKYTRKMIEQCFFDGYWALGTGNSLTNYMPVENYLIALDEGAKIS